MNRRTFLRRSTILPIAVPLAAISADSLQEGAGPGYAFYGEFGRAVEEEFQHQLRENSYVLFGETASERTKQWLHIVVANLGEGKLSTAFEEFVGAKENLDSYYGFFILCNTWVAIGDKHVRNEQTWTNLVTSIRLFEVHRVFSPLDGRGHAIDDDWPLKWRNTALSIEQKQIVWELLKLS